MGVTAENLAKKYNISRLVLEFGSSLSLVDNRLFHKVLSLLKPVQLCSAFIGSQRSTLYAYYEM